jgi:hypothetical protein
MSQVGGNLKFTRMSYEPCISEDGPTRAAANKIYTIRITKIRHNMLRIIRSNGADIINGR